MDILKSLHGMDLNLLYLGCVLLGVGYVLMSVVMGSMADMGHSIVGHHGGDTGGGGDGIAVHMNFMSPLSLATLIAGFGAFGLITLHALDMKPIPSVFWSAGLAVVLDGLVTFMFFSVFVKAQSNTIQRTSDVVGMEAEIIAPIAGDSVGQIAYATPSGRQTAVARTADGSSIETGRFVRVERFIGNVALVRLLDTTARSEGNERNPQT